MAKRKTQSKTLAVKTDGRHSELSHATEQQASASSDEAAQTPAIKLRIKIGHDTVIGTRSFSLSANQHPSTAAAADDDDEDDVSDGADVPSFHDELSLDEEMLEADESEVTAVEADSSDDDDDDDDDVDEHFNDDKEWTSEGCHVGSINSTTLLTTRQRALLHGETFVTHPAVTVSSVSEEQVHRRQLRANRRREKAFEKNEKDKKETLDRLLKKQGAKAKCPAKAVSGIGRLRCPVVTYVQNASFSAISLPTGVEFPLSATSTAPLLKSRELCGVAGCVNVSKYKCSRSDVNLCSLECYRRNLASLSSSSSCLTAPST